MSCHWSEFGVSVIGKVWSRTSKLPSLTRRSRIDLPELVLVLVLYKVMKASTPPPFWSTAVESFKNDAVTLPARRGPSLPNAYLSSPVSPASVSLISATWLVPAATTTGPVIVITRLFVVPSNDVTWMVSVSVSLGLVNAATSAFPVSRV